MRNAYRAGNAMRGAMEMDGRGPPSTARITPYGNSSTTTSRNTPEFMEQLEKLGARGRVAEAYLGAVSEQRDNSGEIILTDGIRYRITRTGKTG